MRILVVQPTGDKRGHYGPYTAKLCQAVGELGHDVTLCTNRLHVSRYLTQAPRFRLIEVGGGRLAYDRFDEAITCRPLHYYFGYFRNSIVVTATAIGLCRRLPFDAVVVMDAEFMTASLLLRWARHRIPPVAMFLWAANFSFETYQGSVLKRAYKVVQREVFRLALRGGIRALAVLGEWHRDRLRAQLKLPDDFPIGIIPDGADTAVDMPDRLTARRRLKLPDTGPLFLFFGVLRRDKGVEHLLDAVARFPPGTFNLVLAGWPMEYAPEEIASAVQRRGIADRLILRLAYMPDEEVPAYFAACDALVLPYCKAYTGGSGPLMKGACTYGRPVIATRVSEMGYLVERHGLGLLAVPEDPVSLAEQMAKFLGLSQTERNTMAMNALALARANSWNSLACRLASLVAGISTLESAPS